MNPRNAIHFLKSPTGAFFGFCILLVIAFVFMKGFQKPAPKQHSKPSPQPTNARPQTVQTVLKNVLPFRPPPPAQSTPTSTVASAPVAEQPAAKQEKETPLPPISLYPETPTSAPKPLGKFFAPYGRLIPCQLIVTVDSSSIRTPIIGLITEDIYHHGRLIIPAATEVHGTAQIDRTRERIASDTGWTLVWQDGQELRIKGVALDRETEATGEGWGITDGSAGLRGRLIKSDNLAEIKLFAATFLSGAASGLTERQETIFGPTDLPSLQNAPLKGAQDVLAVYAKQILDSIQRDGFYVRVPAGKQFYLYVTQTIDKEDALLGGTRLTEVQQVTNQVSTSYVRRSEPSTPPTQP